jgi:DedD protein
MDRALKERIIGAIVLVLFVVLVVPVFLDGPSNSGEVISEQVPLPGQSGEEQQTIVLNRDRTQPVPAASSNKPAAVEPEPTPQQQPKAEAPASTAPAPQAAVEKKPEPAQEKPAVVAAVVPEPSSSTGMWAVQLGSFGNKENADQLAADLKKLGFAAFRSQLHTNSGELFRVRVGPQKDRESAEAVAVQLAKAGQKGQVVPHP